MARMPSECMNCGRSDKLERIDDDKVLCRDCLNLNRYENGRWVKGEFSDE